MKKGLGLTTALKYVFSICIIIFAYMKTNNGLYILMCTFELGSIFLISNYLITKRLFGQLINDLLMFLFNAQIVVLVFGSSFITMVMLTNIHSLEDLAGNAILYITGAILVLVFSLLPIRQMSLVGMKSCQIFCVVLLIVVLLFSAGGKSYSPLYGYYELIVQYQETQKVNAAIAQALEEAKERAKENISQLNTTLTYYNDELKDYREKNEALVERPNIILIFTEGLSQSVISDERNIMPNVKKYQNQSISFDNYYNHTFATYRGLIGQLFSGYQMGDFDTNELVSLQSILANQGYKTYFINTEPNNRDFTKYLNNMGFYKVLSNQKDKCQGMLDSLSDEEAYETLFEYAEKYSEDIYPFFISIYTFGTHASFDTRGEEFGDGSLDELNKFYDADFNFGKFMEKFENSSLADDTIIIFTADHATYQDAAFNTAFPDNTRATNSCDEIPLFIYHKGIEAEVIDVNGRNTLGLAPTILDYLDISEPNYFLGTSLFADRVNSIFETSYTDTYVFYTTKNTQVDILEGEELEEFNMMLQEYYITKELAAY